MTHSSTEPPKVDCLQCKVVGTLTFSSVAAYILHLRHTTPKTDKRARLFFAVIGISSIGMAAYRVSS